MLALLTLWACVVEDVLVDTGGDTGAGGGDDLVDDRPEVPRPTEPDDASEEPTVAGTTLTPSSVAAGDERFVFLRSDVLDLEEVVSIELYGAPDVTVEKWVATGPEELVVDLVVADASPPGELLVVLELADGAVERLSEPLVVSAAR